MWESIRLWQLPTVLLLFPFVRLLCISCYYVVPGPPYILSDRQYTDLIDVDFSEPCEPNGEIIGYQARYQESDGRFSSPISYGPNQRRIRIDGLTKRTKYILELTAKTSLGLGQKATIEFYTKDDPGLLCLLYRISSFYRLVAVIWRAKKLVLIYLERERESVSIISKIGLSEKNGPIWIFYTLLLNLALYIACWFLIFYV
jgi:Fibronectin type III domain.